MIFNEGQKSQLELAKSNENKDVYDLLSKHPDWSPTFMNAVNSKAFKNESYDKIIRFGEATGEDSNGLIGKEDLIFAYFSIESMSEDKDCYIDPIDTAVRLLEKSASKPYTSSNKLIYDVISKCYLIKESTKRVKLSGSLVKSFTLCKALMSEGIDSVAEILSTMRFLGNGISNNPKGNNIHIVLSLDDMNIRGKQIEWAYDYADHSVQSLVLAVEAREPKMVDFVNRSAALYGTSFGRSYMPKAVSGSASFTEGIGFEPPINCVMPSTEYNKYSQSEIAKMTVNYSKLEITNATSIDEAIKILESCGFKVIYNEQKKQLINVSRNMRDEETSFIILHSSNVGAIAKADSAIPRNFMYGGYDIRVPYRERYRNFKFWQGVECNVVDGQDRNSPSAVWVGRVHDGMNCYRDFISDDSIECLKDTTLLGYSGWNGVPLPETYDRISLYHDYEYKHKSVRNLIWSSHDMALHTFVEFANLLRVVEAVKNHIPEESKWLYQPFIAKKYVLVLSTGYFTNDPITNSILLGVLFRMFNIPESEITMYYNASLTLFENHIDKDKCIKALKSNKTKMDFFGKSKVVEEFLDEFNIIKMPAKPESPKMKKLKSKFDVSISPLRELLKGCGAEGTWILYEERGITYLKGGNGAVTIGMNLVIVDGCCRFYTKEKWNSAITVSIKKLNKEVKKPIKKVSFTLGSKSRELDIKKSESEASSFDIYLS